MAAAWFLPLKRSAPAIACFSKVLPSLSRKSCRRRYVLVSDERKERKIKYPVTKTYLAFLGFLAIYVEGSFLSLHDISLPLGFKSGFLHITIVGIDLGHNLVHRLRTPFR